MEILDSTEPFLHWDRNLSELSEDGEIESVLYTNVSDHRSAMDVGVTGSGSPSRPHHTLISSCVKLCQVACECVHVSVRVYVCSRLRGTRLSVRSLSLGVQQVEQMFKLRTSSLLNKTLADMLMLMSVSN